jgi:hypothetical protein
MFGKALQNAKKRAVKRGLSFDLDKEYLLDIFERQDGKCYYSGIKMNIVKDDDLSVHDPLKMSLDCVDPDKGYIKGNVVWSAYCVNTFKQKMSQTEMLRVCESILNNLKK